jgi:hypothetical protein
MRLIGKKIACLAEDGFEDLELCVPVILRLPALPEARVP